MLVSGWYSMISNVYTFYYLIINSFKNYIIKLIKYNIE